MKQKNQEQPISISVPRDALLFIIPYSALACSASALSLSLLVELASAPGPAVSSSLRALTYSS